MKKLRNTTSKLPMSCWAAEDVPSVKAGTYGYRSLTTSELLSIVIGTGTTSENSTDIARRMLADNDNSLRKISKLNVNDLLAFEGIGESKAEKLLAALELGNRMAIERAADRKNLSTAVSVFNYMQPRIGMLDTEEFWVLYLNNNYNLIQAKRISAGGLTEVAVDVRIILREAVLCNATAIVACHNHPSGTLTPSRQDDMLTSSLKKACEFMRIRLTDHVIVTENAYYSYAECGKL